MKLLACIKISSAVWREKKKLAAAAAGGVKKRARPMTQTRRTEVKHI